MKIILKSIGPVDFPDEHQIRFQQATEEYPEGAALIMNGGKLGGLFRLNDIIEIVEEYQRGSDIRKLCGEHSKGDFAPDWCPVCSHRDSMSEWSAKLKAEVEMNDEWMSAVDSLRAELKNEGEEPLHLNVWIILMSLLAKHKRARQ